MGNSNEDMLLSSDNNPNDDHRSGFICLIGPTNAGKSTLMNAIIGQKIAITAPKPQTTRNRILGIHTMEGKGQLIFVDTPGLHRPQGTLGERLVDVAVKSLKDADVALLVVDATLDVKPNPKRPGLLSKQNQAAVERVKGTTVPVVLALNKVDQVGDKSLLLPVLALYRELLGTDELLPISALKGTGLPELQEVLLSRLPQGVLLYPPEMLSGQAERFLAAEIVREKAIMETRQELPYSVAVEVESWKEPEEKGRPLVIRAVIHVERNSQKGIVIGKGGQRLKSIGTQARQELETMFETKIYLELFVHVEKDWSRDPRRLDRFGYK